MAPLFRQFAFHFPYSVPFDSSFLVLFVYVLGSLGYVMVEDIESWWVPLTLGPKRVPEYLPR